MKMFHVIVCLMVYVHTDCGVLALANSDPHHDSKENTNPQTDGMAPDIFQELLWFFRRDDPSSWNYCILGLSVVVLLIGLTLLGINIKANRNRHALALNPTKGDGSTQTDEAELKQAPLSLKEDLGPAAENLLPKAQNSGQVVIQWKDGNVTTLFAEAPEEDV
ncbi:organic solute transporter subunit beta [Tiliqua scincoides]|uniref:organic solute transporter subunit beta n=1 Tax=Tiliqua scincoides TaxID=71010 RepID=UPI003461EE1D